MNDVQHQLNPKVLNSLGRGIGIVMLLIAAGLTALLVFLLERRLTLVGTVDLQVVAFVAVTGTIALFAFVTGWRLALNRPNRHGSLLPPWGWYLLAAAFVLLAGFIGISLVLQGAYAGVVAVAGCLMLALLCGRQGKAAAGIKLPTL